jgi:hypothetical protein
VKAEIYGRFSLRNDFDRGEFDRYVLALDAFLTGRPLEACSASPKSICEVRHHFFFDDEKFISLGEHSSHVIRYCGSQGVVEYTVRNKRSMMDMCID